MTDTLGHEKNFKYGVADRESLLSLPGNRVVSFRFDGSGSLLGLTPPGGDEHTFGYSDVDLNDVYTPPHVSDVADPATSYTYNLDRQLSEVARPGGGRVQLKYNSQHGWLDSLSIARGRKTYTYGSTGQLSAAVSPDSVTSSYVWDGPVLAREAWSGALSGAVARTMNIAFAESTQTVVAGNDSSVVSYTYGDEDGLLTGVSIAGVTESISRRTADGLITGTSVSVGGGTVTSSQDYNGFGELTSLAYAWPGGGAFEQTVDERDGLGRITQLTETVDGGTHSYGYHYDAAGRLDEIRRDGVLQRSYVYDDSLPGNGNRTKEKDGSGTALAIAGYDAQDRLTSYGNTLYEWTANGELARRIAPGPDTTRTTYDELGNLIGAHLPGAAGDSITYVIDASDRRVGRIVNGQRTQSWLYAGQISVVAELDGAGALRHRYAYGTSSDVPDLLEHAGDIYRLITDHLGSVRVVVRVSDGAVVQRLDLDAWGVPTLDTNRGWQSLGFVGGLMDTSTGIIRFGARDYDPEVGRWTTKDPLGIDAGIMNMYAYVRSRPIDATDLDGCSDCSILVNRIMYLIWTSGSEREAGLQFLLQLNSTPGGISGYKAPLTAGGQGSDIERHVFGHAGAVLAGGVAGMGVSLVNATIDFRQRYSRGLAESRAEILDDAVAWQVASEIAQAYADIRDCPRARERILRRLRWKLMLLLCHD